MSNWARCSIGEICDEGFAELQTGPFGTQLHANDYVASGIAVVPTGALRGRRIDRSILPEISLVKAEELKRHKLRSGDILFARRGVQATGHIGYVREGEAGFICGTGVIRLRVTEDNPKISPDFLSHVFANPTSIQWFKFHAIGATMPNLNEGIIRAFTFSLPPLEEQRRIAVLLNAIDDKINLNRRMNETLEAMARAIFKDWFVDFGPTRAQGEGRSPYLASDLWALFPAALDDEKKPEGWANGTLGGVLQQRQERIHPSKKSNTLVYVPIECITAKSIFLQDYKPGSEAKTSLTLFKQDDIIFGAMRPYFHKVCLAPFEGVTRTTAFVLRSRTASDRNFSLICAFQDETIEFATNHSEGSTIPYAKWSGSLEIKPIILPPPELRRVYGELVEPLIAKGQANIVENRRSAALRDLLLPKLMSGEICVRDGDKMASAAL